MRGIFSHAAVPECPLIRPVGHLLPRIGGEGTRGRVARQLRNKTTTNWMCGQSHFCAVRCHPRVRTAERNAPGAERERKCCVLPALHAPRVNYRINTSPGHRLIMNCVKPASYNPPGPGPPNCRNSRRLPQKSRSQKPGIDESCRQQSRYLRTNGPRRSFSVTIYTSGWQLIYRMSRT